MVGDSETQRIARLTPVDDVLAAIDRQVAPVAARPIEVAAAVGYVLAADAVPLADRPGAARALRDGFAVRSDVIADASSYAPMPLAAAPTRVDVGDALPAATDAVVPLDAVVGRDGRFEAIAPVAPGDGVLAADGDMRAGEPLRRAGERLRSVDVAVLAAAGIERVMVRVPRIRLVPMRADGGIFLAAAHDLLARVIAADGGAVTQDGHLQPAIAAPTPADGAPPARDLVDALAPAGADAVIAIGGTGSGRGDASVRTLARSGRVEVHGVALTPGETAAFGFAGARPVLLVPGRLDAALAVWLVLGRRMLARLSAGTEEQPAMSAPLARKIASPVGLLEVVPVRRRGAQVEPIASGYWPLHAIAQAHGWILVPADSEGYPAHAEVMVRPWP